MTIPPRFLDELRSRLTLSEIVGKRVRITRAGREYKGCCPFHNEKSPSFYVNDDKQFYHCFGCGAHGSAIDFVMNTNNFSFIEAVESLALLVGMQVPQSSPQEVEKAKKEKSLYTLLDDAARFFEDTLRAAPQKAAFDYILKRMGGEEMLNAFRVGFAPSDPQALRRALAAKEYKDDQMLEAGVLKLSSKGGEPYAFFRDRVMFPVPDRRGRVVAFGGRILPEHLRQPDKGDFKPPKYINSADTPLFHKGLMLYGEPRARQAAIDGQPVLVVEGYLDVVACVRAGLRGAVAPLGTALTEEQIMVLWKMIPGREKIPVLCFDGDEAGRRAASRACERILPHLKPDHSARIAFLPEGEDPDTLISAKGADAIHDVLNRALPMVDYIWQSQIDGRDFSTPESRAGLSHALDQEASRIADRGVQYFYKEAFREKIKKTFAPLSQSSQSGWKAPGGSSQRPVWQPRDKFGKPIPPPAVSSLRRPGFTREHIIPMALLAGIINNPAIFGDVEEEAGNFAMPEKGLDRLRQAVLSTLGHNQDLDTDALKAHLMERGYGEELKRLLGEPLYTHASFARPSNDPGRALEGWREGWKALEAGSAALDLERAKAAMKEEINEDNEQRLKALRGLRGAPDA